jgi:uncharacterized protein
MKVSLSRVPVWFSGFISFVAAVVMMSTADSAPSFDCKSSKHPNEKLICQSTELSELDNRMVAIFYSVLNYLNHADKGELKQSQQRWLRERLSCDDDFTCTKRAYTERIERLATVMARVRDRSTPSEPPPPAPEQSRMPDGDYYSKVGWWTITHRVVGSLSGCDAASRFQDETLIEMALIQSNANNKEWAIFISNPRWNAWISRKRQHTLRFVTTRNWQGNFAVNDYNALWMGGLSIEFRNTIADADSLMIMNENNERLASLDMKDSAAAIQAVVNCVRDHPYVSPPEPETMLSGTAFFVASNRLITNNHVVRDCRRLIEIKYPDQAAHSAHIDAQDDANDLALLHTDMTSPSVASFHYRPRLGEQVATYGFPYSGLLSSNGNFTLGNVTALSGMNDDSRFLQISTPIQPGNSG